MKLLVDKIPKDKQGCLFYHQDIDGYGGFCTLSGKNEIHCWMYDNECEMCVTYDKFMLEKIEKLKNTTCFTVEHID